MFSKSTVAGATGAVLLAAGTLAPIVTYPIIGQIDVVESGHRGAIVLIVCAVAALLLIVFKQSRWLWLPGLGALGMLVLKFFRMQSSMSRTLETLEATGVDTLDAGRAFARTVHFEWGWIVLLLGAVLMIVAGATAEEKD